MKTRATGAPAATVRAMLRQRLDALLAERGKFPSRTAAAAAVRAGEVQLGRDGPYAKKPSQLVDPQLDLVVEEGPRFVSRGGLKLQNALEELQIDVTGRDCLDVGASTGGFTDCLLQRGAARVAAVDVGHGELDWRLRNDERVAVRRASQRTRALTRRLAVRPLAGDDRRLLHLAGESTAGGGADAGPEGEILALVKPQFELGPGRVGKGGVVRDPGARREALAGAASAATSLGLAVLGFASSGLPGPKGNRETFLWCSREGDSLPDLEAALRGVEP